jgi:cell division septum initiation protein DivIVA
MSMILDSVIADLQHREAKGLKEYGTTVDRNDYELLDWLKEAYEETLDKAVYLKCAIAKLQKQINDGKEG